MKEISLYVHIPFCVKKCSYCNFYSIPYTSDLANEYLAALLKELNKYKDQDYIITSVYLGGGTPSLLSFFQLIPLISAIGHTFEVSATAEVTLEANPSTITKDKARDWKTLGINRVSIGTQSFNDNELKILGRFHSVHTIDRSIEFVKTHCTENVSLDLMYGIPEQTFASWNNSLGSILELQPTHISSYCLSIEQNTPLFKSQNYYNFPSEMHQNGMYYMMKSMLEGSGYNHYEISNFSLPGYHSRHNDAYWLGKEYIGLGAAAHSFLDLQRIENISNASRYIHNIINDQSITENKRLISERELISDKIFLGLRRLEGIDLSEFKDLNDFDILKEYEHETENYLKSGYLTVDNDHLKLTRKALFISDEILREFV